MERFCKNRGVKVKLYVLLYHLNMIKLSWSQQLTKIMFYISLSLNGEIMTHFSGTEKTTNDI